MGPRVLSLQQIGFSAATLSVHSEMLKVEQGDAGAGISGLKTRLINGRV